MDFEYAIKKDIRKLWRSMGVGLFLVVVLLFSAWQHFELVQHGYRIESMQQQRAAEEEINRRLKLEVETLSAPRRIERIATEQLHLVAPSRDQAIVIERVTPAAPPEKSIVAAR
jgi:cell division protein FtsL